VRRFEPLGNWSQNNVRGVLGQHNFKRGKDRDRKRERERKKQKKREKRKKKEREKESCFFRILAWTRTRTRSRAMSRPATAAGAGAAGPVTQATNSWHRDPKYIRCLWFMAETEITSTLPYVVWSTFSASKRCLRKILLCNTQSFDCSNISCYTVPVRLIK